MEFHGKKGLDSIEKLLAAKAAMEAAGLPVPDAIEAQLGAGYEDKSPNELCLVTLPSEALSSTFLHDQQGMQIDLTKLPRGLLSIVVLPNKAKSDEEGGDSNSAGKGRPMAG